MVQEQQPPQGRKTDARKESNGAGKDAKNDPVDNQALELGAAQSADLQVAATAPAAMGSLTGYIQDDFVQSQHDAIVNDDAEQGVGAVTAREFSAPKAETAHDATTETRFPEVTASTAHPLGEEVLDTSSAPDASPPTQGSSSLASSVPELPPQQAEIAFEAPSGAIAEKTDARLEQASEETEDKTWPTEPVQVFELQLAEGNAGGSTVLALPVEGEFGDRITYSFTDATGNPVDHDDFHLFGNLLQVAPGGAPDFEAGDSQVLYVTATTPAGTSPPWPIRLTITDVAEDLVLDDGGAAFTDLGVSEHSITGGAGADRIAGHEASGMVDGASGDDTLIGGAGSDSLTGGAGNDLLVGGYADDVAFFTGRWADYRITDEDGVISVVDLRPGSPDGTDMLVDVETLHFADGWVTAADAPNDAPVLQAYGGSISENDPGAVVADVASRDADAGDTVALSVDDARFEVVDGTLKLREGVSLDYEADGPQIAVTILATDSHGATDTQTVIVTVADTGEALVLDSGGVELADVGVAEVSITGNEGADRIAGHDAGGVLDGAGGDDTLSGGAAADTLTGGLGDDVLIGGGGADVAVFSGSWADYTIAESDGFFKVTDNRVDSPDGSDTLSGIEVLRFSDGDRSIADALNDAPVLEVADGSVAENVAGSIVGRVSSTDADAGDKSRFTVDDPRFEVQGGGLLKLRDGVSLDYESDGPALTVTVTATDSHGATGSQTVTVTVTDTGEALVLDNGGAVFTDLGVAETTIVGGDGGDRISGHATDGGVLDGALGDDTLSGGSGDETIMGGEGSDHAIWSGNLAEFAVSYDSAGDAFTIRDQDASDGDEGTDTVTGVESFEFGGLTYDAAEMQTEAARQANSGPGSASVASGGAVDENSAPGTVVATLTASDADGDALTFSLSDADGNPVTDGNFVIVGSEIRVSRALRATTFS